MGAKTGPKGPWKMTEEVLGKLQQAFAIDATIEEACFYADINPDTYYRWKKDNQELSERFERLRNTPILAARQTLATAVKSDAQTALKYLERKRRVEFATKTEVEQSGDLNIKLNELEDNQLDARLEAIIEKQKNRAA